MSEPSTPCKKQFYSVGASPWSCFDSTRAWCLNSGHGKEERGALLCQNRGFGKAESKQQPCPKRRNLKAEGSRLFFHRALTNSLPRGCEDGGSLSPSPPPGGGRWPRAAPADNGARTGADRHRCAAGRLGSGVGLLLFHFLNFFFPFFFCLGVCVKQMFETAECGCPRADLAGGP